MTNVTSCRNPVSPCVSRRGRVTGWSLEPTPCHSLRKLALSCPLVHTRSPRQVFPANCHFWDTLSSDHLDQAKIPQGVVNVVQRLELLSKHIPHVAIQRTFGVSLRLPSWQVPELGVALAGSLTQDESSRSQEVNYVHRSCSRTRSLCRSSPRAPSRASRPSRSSLLGLVESPNHWRSRGIVKWRLSVEVRSGLWRWVP